MNFFIYDEYCGMLNSLSENSYCNKIFIITLCFVISSANPTSKNRILHCNVECKKKGKSVA